MAEHRGRLMSDHDADKPDRISRVDTSHSSLASVVARVREAEAWRQGVAWSSLLALAILILNVVVTIWASARYGTTDGVGVGYEGDCTIVEYWTTSLKVAINVLSSALLGVSNYTMQCLSSPTRKDLDRAHKAGDWMDVGVSGVRNLFRIRKYRVILWALLAVSSVPVHLFYNSTIFKTLSANVYTVVVVNDDFLTNQAFQHQYWLNDPTASGSQETAMSDEQLIDARHVHRDYLANKTAFTRLENNRCIDTYYTTTLSGRSNVIVVADYEPIARNNTVLYMNTVDYSDKEKLAYAWICHDSGNNQTGANPAICNAPRIQQHADTWTINGKSVRYCLSQDALSFCKLEFCNPMLIAVILCNVIKCVAMLLAAWSHKDAILATTGDAVASYLDRPDESTEGRCLTGIGDIRHEPYPWSFLTKHPRWDENPPLPKDARLHNRRWFSGASKKRWYATSTLVLSSCTVVAVFLGLGVAGLAKRTANSTAPWTIGFGAVNTQALTGASLPQSGSWRIVSAVILANTPQMILSFIYLGYNGLFTCMILAAEWNGFSQERRALRVSCPKGAQKCSRFLSLPYRFSIPLLVGSMAMHFLVSESIYLVRIAVYKGHTRIASDGVSNLGYSPKAMATLIGLGVYVLLLALAVGMKKLDGSMPVAGSCSVAIAAACHPPKDDHDAALLPVMWGEPLRDGEESDGVRHCTFTSKEVSSVTVGAWYAG